MPERKGAQLNIDDREYIEEALKRNESFREIARHLDVSPTTVSNEVRNNRIFTKQRKRDLRSYLCQNFKECRKRELCGDNCIHRGYCRLCEKVPCIKRCPDFVPYECAKRDSAPFVCLDCRKHKCGMERAVYRASAAQAAYERRLGDARGGIALDADELERMVLKVRRLLAQGQSIEAIWMTHGDEFPVCERTFYNYMHKGVMGMTLLELRNSVSRRPRKTHASEGASRGSFTDRTYADWCALPEETRISTVEMDCVEGRKIDSKVILSLHFRRFEFQLYILLEEQTQKCVTAALDAVEAYCNGRFKDIFGVILTDRGHEFLDTAGLEKNGRCRVYYCDPVKPGQKGSCEKNHVELRKILPKKVSDFDALTQWDVSEACSHVNSYPRAALGGVCPISLASQVLPQDLLDCLGIRRIEPDDVVMKPDLLKNNGDSTDEKQKR